MEKQTVWIDDQLCTGCGSCVEACPTEAIALANGKAHVDEALCRGCEVCIDACPEGAIQPVLQGELVTTREQPAPAVREKPHSLAETAGVAIAAASAGVLAKVGGALVRALGTWLTQRSESAGTVTGQRDTATGVSAPTGNGRRTGRGRRGRHRRRGR